MHLEGAQCVFVICGREYHCRNGIRADGLDQLEPVKLRHLHVKEHDVWRSSFDQRGGPDAAALSGDLDFWVALEQNTNGFSRQRLVIDDDRPQRHAISRQGIEREARTPSPRSCISKRCASP